MGWGMKCPVSTGCDVCNREEMPVFRRLVIKGTLGIRMIHRDCGLHRFHTSSDGEYWEQCDCMPPPHTPGRQASQSTAGDVLR